MNPTSVIPYLSKLLKENLQVLKRRQQIVIIVKILKIDTKFLNPKVLDFEL